MGVGFIVLVYTIVSVCLWRATNHANERAKTSVENADRNFRRDERAWMAFSSTSGNITFTIDKPFLIPTKTLNTGKTPAKNVPGNVVVGIFKKGEPLNFDYSSGHGNANYGIQSGTTHAAHGTCGPEDDFALRAFVQKTFGRSAKADRKIPRRAGNCRGRGRTRGIGGSPVKIPGSVTCCVTTPNDVPRPSSTNTNSFDSGPCEGKQIACAR